MEKQWSFSHGVHGEWLPPVHAFGPSHRNTHPAAPPLTFLDFEPGFRNCGKCQTVRPALRAPMAHRRSLDPSQTAPPMPSAILLVASLRNQSSSDGGLGGWAVICSWFGATIAIAAGPDSNPIAVNAGHRFSDLPLRQSKPRSAGMAALPLPSRANRVACRQPQGLLLPLAWLRARA